MLSRPIGLLAYIVVASGSVILGCPQEAHSTDSGVGPDYCYPTRDAALAAFGNGQVVIVEGEIVLERSGRSEIFEILIRPSDSAAVLLDSHDEGVACVLIQGRDPTQSHSGGRPGAALGSAARPAGPR